MVGDEVMAGFGRTGRWFAVDHWDVVPDLMTMAKGLTSSYLPLGAVAMRHTIAEAFESRMFYGGLTYNCHPWAAPRPWRPSRSTRRTGSSSAARLGARDARPPRAPEAKHPCVGADRNIGLFGILELVRDRATVSRWRRTTAPATR